MDLYAHCEVHDRYEMSCAWCGSVARGVEQARRQAGEGEVEALRQQLEGAVEALRTLADWPLDSDDAGGDMKDWARAISARHFSGGQQS